MYDQILQSGLCSCNQAISTGRNSSRLLLIYVIPFLSRARGKFFIRVAAAAAAAAAFDIYFYRITRSS